MLTTHNRGDVPFNEAQYSAFKNGDKRFIPTPKLLQRMGVKNLIEITPDQDLGAGSIKAPSLALSI
jgi:hypothetical protein